MKQITAQGELKSGKLRMYNEAVFRQELADIGDKNHIRLTLEYGNKRSLDQNNFLHGAVVASIRLILQQHGYDFTHAETYRYLERKFCNFEAVNTETGEVYTKVKALKELTTDEFSDIVVDKIRTWASKALDVYIQLPHEYYQMTEDAYELWKKGAINKTEAIKMSRGDNE